MFDKKQKSCVKRIHLVNDDGLYDRKAFYKAKIVFYSSSMVAFSSWDIGQYVYCNYFFSGCDAIDFEIKLIFLINLFFYMTKKSR